MKKFFISALNWIFGSILLLLGITLVFQDPWPSLPLIGMSLFLLPPVRNFFYTKFKMEIGFKPRAAIIGVLSLTFAGFVLAGYMAHKKQQERIALRAKIEAEHRAEVNQQLTNEFNANSAAILSEVTKAINAKDFQKAVSISRKYLVAKNPDLSTLYNEADADLIAQQKKEKAQRILATLKTTPATNYSQNESLYQKLKDIYPDNKEYAAKFKKYKALEARAEMIAKEKKERTARIQNLFSPWDGSLPSLEKAIKDSMNDPDSYKHVKTVYWDRGSYLVVRTTFRGKNAFGGVVTNSVTAKVDLNGNVLQILGQD